MYLKLTYFCYPNLILFLEKNYKKDLLVLHSAEIFCNLISRIHWTWI